MITLTDNAVQEFRTLLAAKQAPETSGLGLGTQRGGCGTSFEPKEDGKKPEYDPALDGTKCS